MMKIFGRNGGCFWSVLLVFCASILLVLLIPAAANAETLEVGDGKTFSRIEAAVAQAKAGDVIDIHPKKDGLPYRQPAILISTAKLTLRGADPKTPVVLDGAGFDYSGRGSTPRAIIQFDLGADGCVVDGLTLINAKNASHNGAGIRINQANDVTVRNCIIRNNEMGIMSNGEFAKKTGARQVIEKCRISHNGTHKNPGYNHNLYLGGTSVTVRECDIRNSVTGHNLKSRAHLNLIVNNVICDSANRELDLVDAAGTTDVPGSDAYIVGNTIQKAANCTGNRTVIHFGRDGKATHNGTLWLVGNTIRTPFVAPVADLSSGKGVVFLKNTVEDAGKGQNGTLSRLGSADMICAGSENKLPGRFIIRAPESGEQPPISLEKPPTAPDILLPYLSEEKAAVPASPPNF